MIFKDCDLSPGLLKALEEKGFKDATPIQQKAMPKIASGVDLLASAQTGTGKTGAFLIPLLERISRPSPINSRGPRVLILVPTRELAVQVAKEAVELSKYLKKVSVVTIYGGAPYPIQIRQLSRPHEILVATPGRLIDHLERGRLDFSRLETLILDEADRMLDMGFIKPVEQIAAATPKERQTLLFSATLKKSVLALAKDLLNKPQEIHVSAPQAKHDLIDQRLHETQGLRQKNELLDKVLKDESINQAIIFTSTKRHADQLSKELCQKGHLSASLHGDMNQRERNRTIRNLKSGEVKLVVATDVAARGIDIDTITHVINFDLPMNAEDYVHRIGRTGRAGRKGVALSFASPADRSKLKAIEKYTGLSLSPVKENRENRESREKRPKSRHRRA
ncbi:MAG: DEAD/DEAH box helicase [Chlamydiia bacterium]|nr:DEAD/DEAH box helicase [Chlamydiia bacterium]